MKIKTLYSGMLASVVVLVLAGCQTTKVQRVDVAQEIALSDRWNDTDSRLVSEAMISDMLGFPWIDQHVKQQGQNPAVIVLRIRNKSHEHIPVETFVNDLKRAMLRTGRVDFVAADSVRDDIRKERKDQELNASLETQNEMGEELGADYALSGSILSTVDQVEGKRVTFYQVDLRLVDMSNNKEVWNGQHKIKKYQEKSSFGL